jgi:hypothetical protein
LVISTPSRASPIAASIRSISSPARPANGAPSRSSSALGIGPITMMPDAGLPLAKTVDRALFFRLQPLKASSAVCSSASERALSAAKRAAATASPSGTATMGAEEGAGAARRGAAALPGEP